MKKIIDLLSIVFFWRREIEEAERRAEKERIEAFRNEVRKTTEYIDELVKQTKAETDLRNKNRER